MEVLSGLLPFNQELFTKLSTPADSTSASSPPSLQTVELLPSSSSTHFISQDIPAEPTAIAVPSKRGHKPHVPKACVNCKKAHLACDVSRPCKRCISLDKTGTCQDVTHKKRGRPKLSERRATSLTKEHGAYAMMYSTLQMMNPSLSTGLQQPPDIKQPQQPLYIFHEYPCPITQASSTPELKASLLPAPSPQSRTVTLILSMEVFCARTSNAVAEWWGYNPQEMCHRTLYDFISSKDAHRLAALHRLLLDSVVDATHPLTKNLPNTIRTTSNVLHDTDLVLLTIAAPGSQTFTDTVCIKKKNGDMDNCDMTVYLGGGLGADLRVPSSLSSLYIVAELQRENSPTVPTVPATASNTIGSPGLISTETPSSLFNSFLSSLSTSSYLTASIPYQESEPDIIPAPLKVNIAPNTSRLSGYRPISFASMREKPSPHPRESSNPYSTLAHRYSQRGSTYTRPGVTHPSTQYFLQTSSSTLSAAASAAQPKRSSSGAQSSVDTSVTSRKATGSSDRNMGMSIRSLLC